jgi:TldD protein
MEWLRRLGAVSALVITAGGCPGPGGTGGKGKGTNPLPPNDPAEMKYDLPAIPAKIETTQSAPTEGHSPDARSPMLDIMKSEIEREMATLGKQKDPAYYIAYQLFEQRSVSIDSEGGAIISDNDNIDRKLDVEVRVGSPEVDNTRSLADDGNGINGPLSRQGVAPFGDDKQALSNALWLETDRRYREAVTALGYVRQDLSTLKKQKQEAPDFSHSVPEVYIEKPAKLTFDKAAWVERLKKCSAKALKGQATRGSCSVNFTLNTSWMVNSEGSQIQQSWTSAQIAVSVGVKADDGMNLSRLEQRFARSPNELPPDSEIDKMIAAVTGDLDALHKAPLADPYVGPVILEGRAAGVFFHEVFGHRMEGHRQKKRESGQTFTSYVGKEIAPEWLSVYDDSQLQTLNGVSLNGFYRFDDEAVRSRKVSLIDKGKLMGFYLGRDPIKGFPTSNGHGRRQQGSGLMPVARQGNLVVETTRSVPRTDLEKLLIDEVRRQKRPYGMMFTDISGGVTNTDAFEPQAFRVFPVMAYRLYPDGKKELVRGLNLIGTPLIALQSIRAASREVETFNGFCGAESGFIPVSASAPSLLIEKLEVEKGFIPADRPPILGAPGISATRPVTK